MKKIMILFMIGTAMTAFGSDRNKTKPEKVTVFPAGALVQHTAVVKLTANSKQVILSNLPVSIDQSSLRVSAEGNFTLLNAAYQTADAESIKRSEKEKRYSDSADYYGLKKAETEGLLQALNEERELLAANRKLGGEGAAVTASQLKQTADFYRERIADIHKKQYNLNKEKRDIDKDLKRVNDSLKKWSDKRNRMRGEVVVTVDVPSAQTARFTLSYYTNNAGWKPEYDLRAYPDEGRLEVTMQASVFQNTGVDWDQVTADISTARPSSFVKLPQLYPWKLRFLPDQQQHRMKRSTYAPSAASMESASEEEVQADNRNVKVTDNTLSLDISLGSPLSLKGDGTAETAVLRKFELDNKLEYRAVPKQNKHAFLTALIPEPMSYQLIPGKMKIFTDDVFTGQTSLSQSMINQDTLDLSIGTDERITVERKQVEEFSSSRRFSSKIERSFGYSIEVSNGKKRNLELIVYDQIPLSTHKDIDIKHDLAEGANLNENTGVFRYPVRVSGGGKADFDFNYKVTHPEDKKISL